MWEGNKMKAFFQKRIVRISLLVCLIIFLVSFYFVKIYSGIKYNIVSEDNVTVVGDENLHGGIPIAGGITEGMQVAQSFVATKDNLRGFSLRFATYIRINYCTMKIELLDSDNNVVFSDLFYGEDLTDNTLCDFMFDKIENSKGHTYNIVITGIDVPLSNEITMYLSPNDVYANGTFSINGEVCEGDTPFKIYYEEISLIVFNIISNILLVILIILILLNIYFNIDLVQKKYNKQINVFISGVFIFLIQSLLISKLVDSGENIKICFNFRGLIILVLFLIFIIFMERKLLYFKWIKSIIMEKKKFADSLGSFSYLLIYISSNIANIILIILFVFLGSMSWKRECVVLFFVYSAITLILNIINNIFVCKKKPSYIFLSTSLILGILFSCCFPATSFVSFDDVIHYENSAAIRNLIFDKNFTKADYAMTASSYPVKNFINNDVENAKKILVDDNNLQLYLPHIKNPYTCIGYIPTAIIMALSDFVGLDFFKMIVLSKYINSVMFSIIIYHAMKRLKSGSFLFASINLIPQIQFLSSQFTYDTWVNAFIQYSIVYLISIIQDPKHIVTKTDCIKMFGAVILGCGPKSIYCIVLLSFLFIDKNKFKNLKSLNKYRLMCILILMAVLLSFVLPFLFNTSNATDSRGGESVNSTLQLKFILSEPVKYAGILIGFMADYLSLEMFCSWICKMGYVGTAEFIFISICAFIIGFNVFTDKNRWDRFRGNIKFRIILVFTALIQVVFMSTALYISYTAVGLDTVNGMQYRYFYPVLFMFLYSLGSSKINNHISEKIRSLITFGGMAMISVFSIYTTYINQLIAK